ncbi:MAG TPA: pyridoxamine 5'-phosphate oxidase family protein [Solirubrobacterales bacterium]|nr:pyridoxamine 5'-phosphate oxidase family protein [Solirubrobacterales bacterium]
MANRRDQIELTDSEIADYLTESKTIICATNGPRGLPHTMPLWYIMRGDEIYGWTFEKSQKAKNLQRDARATLLIEDGVTYDQLRAVMMECDAELIADAGEVREIAIDLFSKYTNGNVTSEVEQMIDAQLPKRIGLRFTPKRYVSWDHRKLGGTY